MKPTIKVLMHRIGVKPLSVDDWDEGRRRAKAMGLELAPIDTTGADKSRVVLSVDIGEVTQVGPTAYNDFKIDSPIKVGQVVAYVKSAGKLIKNPFTEEELLCLNDEDIVAILEKEAA